METAQIGTQAGRGGGSRGRSLDIPTCSLHLPSHDSSLRETSRNMEAQHTDRVRQEDHKSELSPSNLDPDSEEKKRISLAQPFGLSLTITTGAHMP